MGERSAGTGNISRYLKENGYTNISVGEMHLNGLKYAKNYGIDECYQFDLLNIQFENEFDAVCLFDVLEYIKDDDLALQNINFDVMLLDLDKFLLFYNFNQSYCGLKKGTQSKNTFKALKGWYNLMPDLFKISSDMFKNMVFKKKWNNKVKPNI